MTDNFSRKEFACKCGCGYDSISPLLVSRLEDLRKLLGNKPIAITSGCRCPDHNYKVGGGKNSAHLRGMAADIQVSGGQERKKYVDAALVWFDRVGVAKTFVHVDVDATLSQDVLWTY